MSRPVLALPAHQHGRFSMDSWRKTLIGPTASIKDAVDKQQKSGYQIAVIVDTENKLLGTVTDGDVRRGLLNGFGMNDAVNTIMRTSPYSADIHTSSEKLRGNMATRLLRQIPLLDGNGVVAGLAHVDKIGNPDKKLVNWVVLMAGGLGKRLRPLTDETPKPLLSVGKKPLLHNILESFVRQNFSHFYISVNYKSDAIKDYFGDGNQWNTNIRYLEEDKRLGTAGALRLITERPDAPVIVMNGDLLTRVNFNDLLNYHRERGSKATMCVREYDFEVPFGVVEINGDQIKKITEKPVHRFFVNAGIYVINPDLFELIPHDTYFDMTSFFDMAIEAGKETTVFPIHEYWLDVGRIADLDRADFEFEKNFTNG